MIAERTFAPAKASVPAVRRFVLASLEHLRPEILDKVRLLASELATNAVVYAGTDFRVTVRCDDDRLVVTVGDHGGGTPQVRPTPPPTEPHGRGLVIVSRLADEWGINRASGGQETAVWFLLYLSPVIDFVRAPEAPSSTL